MNETLEKTQPSNDGAVLTEAEGLSPSEWKRFVLDILETLILAVVLYVGINAVTARVRVDGFSMNPTLANGEYILINKMAYKFGEPVRGDIIVFKFPEDPEQDLIKRVIALPGETVSIHDGKVTINGVLLDEPYIAAPPFYSNTWVVEPGHLFVLGDNRNESKDSHEWGLLPIENIIGKAVLIYWPPPKWEVIDHLEQASAAQ